MRVRGRVRISRDYQVLITMLDSCSGQGCIIRRITYDDLDPTSLDFRLSVDLPKLKRTDAGIANNGPSQMFRIGGDGFIGTAVPKESCLGILTFGEKGERLDKTLGGSVLCWGVRSDNIESAGKYLDVFKRYYGSL